MCVAYTYAFSSLCGFFLLLFSIIALLFMFFSRFFRCCMCHLIFFTIYCVLSILWQCLGLVVAGCQNSNFKSERWLLLSFCLSSFVNVYNSRSHNSSKTSQISDLKFRSFSLLQSIIIGIPYTCCRADFSLYSERAKKSTLINNNLFTYLSLLCGEKTKYTHTKCLI